MYLNVRSLVGLEPTPKISLPSVDDVQKFRASPGRKSKQHLSPCHPWFTLGCPQRQMNGPGNRSLLLQNNRSDNYINSLYIVLQAIIASVCKKETCFTSLCTLRWGTFLPKGFSSSIPTHSPSANWVVPTKRTMPAQFCAGLQDGRAQVISIKSSESTLDRQLQAIDDIDLIWSLYKFKTGNLST